MVSLIPSLGSVSHITIFRIYLALHVSRFLSCMVFVCRVAKDRVIDDAYNRVVRGLEDQARTDLRIIQERAKITEEFDHTQRQTSERENLKNKEHT